MASVQASSSRSKIDEPAPTPEELTALTSLLSGYYSKQPTKTNVTNLYLETKQAQTAAQKSLEASLLSQAPSFLKLHKDITVSKNLLGQLESFLNIFYNDLSTLSMQMKTLQGKSNHLGKRLRNRRQLEEKVRVLVSAMVLDPRFVDMIFTDEASMGKVSLDVWKECAEKLSACIRACEALEETFREDLNSAGITDIKALQEARDVVEGCRVMAVTKIRPILISTFSPLRSSLSTNLPILQTILLKSYRPLYSFLSHHAPRVAIDVQRSYVAAARLYFETGFRRYERSLAKARDREKARTASYTSDTTSSLSFIEPVKAASGIGSLLPSANASSTIVDPWMAETDQLDNCKVTEGPAVTLAYLADDTSYKAPVEALFRSLSLTFLDNGTSEYCFLARFFERVDVQGGSGDGIGDSTITSSVGSSSAVKVKKEDAIEIDSDGPLPEESASVQGHEDDNEEVAAGTVVGLSEAEKRRLRGRGAIDGLWKQVMEPVMGTYNTFVTSILATQPSLLSLYTMLKLNDNILATVQDRGASSILQGTFMTFKLKGWPLLQKQFDDVLESVKKIKGDGAGGASTLLGSFGGLFAGSAATSSAAKEAHDQVLRLICTRYARLYSSIVRLNNNGEEDNSIFASLLRLRGEIESMLAKADAGSLAACHEVILAGLASGPASVSQARMQSEISHWREAKRSRSGV
jgi:hypothetical protein